jgi:hypothetical protein
MEQANKDRATFDAKQEEGNTPEQQQQRAAGW